MEKGLIFTFIYSAVQWIALIAAVVTFKKYRKTPEKVFLYFLIYGVLITELVGHLLLWLGIGITNTFLYNLFTLVSYLVYLSWFYKILPSKQKLILFFGIVFVTTWCYMLTYGTFFTNIWTVPVIVGSIFIFILTILYFAQLLQQDQVVSIYSSQQFWIAIGLFIFTLGIAPTLFFQDDLDIYGALYGSMLTFLNIILYGSLIIGFLCLYKK